MYQPISVLLLDFSQELKKSRQIVLCLFYKGLPSLADFCYKPPLSCLLRCNIEIQQRRPMCCELFVIHH